MHPRQARWAGRHYSGYKRGQSWPQQDHHPHQEDFSERGSIPGTSVTQFNQIQPEPRNLENPPKRHFTDQSRPSVIRAVKDKSPEFEQRGEFECQTNDNISSHEVSHIENTSLIMKYIHKKFSWKSHSSYVPSEPNSLRSSVIVGSSSASLSTEFNEIFKQEESSQEMENIGSTVDFEDLKLEGHSGIQDFCLTYLAEDVPYLEFVDMCPDARFEKVRIGIKFSSFQGSSLEWGHFGGPFYAIRDSVYD